MTDSDVQFLDEDTPEQQARCRALEMAVLLRALLDACWREEDAAHWQDVPQRQADLRVARLRRAEARSWWLDPGRLHREHIDNIAACAGLPDGWVWRLVDRFVVAGEDMQPIRELYDVMSDRVQKNLVSSLPLSIDV